MSNNTNLNDFDTAISKLIHVAESGGIKTILADTTDNLLQEFAEMHKEGKLVKHKGYPLEVYFTDYIQQAITYVTDYVDALGLASKDEIAFLSIDAFEEGFVNSDDLERLHAKANIRKADKEESSCPGFAKDMKTAWIYVKDDLDNSAEITGEDRKTKNASHSPDFRSVIWNGKKYSFTAYQAACVSVLWKAFDNGTPEVGETKVLEMGNSEAKRLLDVFKSNSAWGTMIVSGKTKGSRRLSPPKQ